MNNSLIDIIIISHNCSECLEDCINSIKKSINGYPVNIIVLDNASSDNFDEVSAKISGPLFLKSKTNLGFAAGVNKALKYGHAPYAVLLNPDTVVQGDFFSKVYNFMENNLDVGIAGPKVLNGDGTIQGSARFFPNPMTAIFGRGTIISKWFPNNRFTRKNVISVENIPMKVMDVDWVSGACMFVRRKAIEDVGAFDERFFMYWEDTDWCKRMWKKGWRVVYYPDSTIVHYIGASSSKKPISSSWQFHKSSFFLYLKYATGNQIYFIPIASIGLAGRFLLVSLYQFLNKSQQPAKIDGQERIRVLRVISRMNIGGPSIHVNLLNQGLDPDKFDSYLVTGRISQDEGDMSYLCESKPPIVIETMQREIKPVLDLKALFSMLKIMIQIKPHIVHSHTAKAGTISRIVAFIYNLFPGTKTRVVHTFHGHVFEGYFGSLKSKTFLVIERLLATATNVIISISNKQKKELVNDYKISTSKKIRIVELGFNLSDFINSSRRMPESNVKDPSTNNNSFRKKFLKDDSSLLVGIVGRLVPIKNHFLFFDAVKIFVTTNPDIKARFIVVGDGELRQKLEAYVDKLGISEKVIFCGWQRDLAWVYNGLDMVVLTSDNEGTPVSIIEAMASSVPVISTDAGGIADLVGNPDDQARPGGFEVCERGVLCGKQDKDSLAMGMKFLATADFAEKKKLVESAKFFVQDRYDRNRLFSDIENLYMELMK